MLVSKGATQVWLAGRDRRMNAKAGAQSVLYRVPLVEERTKWHSTVKSFFRAVC